MGRSDAVTLDAGRRIREALSACRHLGCDPDILAKLWVLGFHADEADHILDVVDDGDGAPTVVQYHIDRALAGAAAMLLAPASAFLAALSVTAGVFALSKAKMVLHPGLAIIVAALAAAPGREMQRHALESEYQRRASEVFEGADSEFHSSLVILEDKDIITRSGPLIRLNETCYVNLTVW
jgi:hypothetical protein